MTRIHIWIAFGLPLGAALLIAACGSAQSARPYIETTGSPLPGYQCFIVRDSGGAVVGGNCVVKPE